MNWVFTSQKTTFFIVTAVKTSNPTNDLTFSSLSLGPGRVQTGELWLRGQGLSEQGVLGSKFEFRAVKSNNSELRSNGRSLDGTASPEVAGRGKAA
jgi:hypothetical protein